MTLIITKALIPTINKNCLPVCGSIIKQYLDAAQFGDLGIYSRDALCPGRADCQTQGQLAVH